MTQKTTLPIAWLLLFTPLLLTGCLHSQNDTTNNQEPAPSTNQFDLSVSVIGSGNVTSTPAGVACGIDCRETLDAGTGITLTATPADSFVFSGWGGACSGSSIHCSLTVNTNDNVTATFSSVTATGVAQLLWDEPVVEGGGTPATLAGYIVSYGAVSGNYTQNMPLPLADAACTAALPATCGYTLNGLTAGTWYFVVRAYDTLGNESVYSNEASKIIL